MNRASAKMFSVIFCLFLLVGCGSSDISEKVTEDEARLRRQKAMGDLPTVPYASLLAVHDLVPVDPEGDYTVGDVVGISGNDYVFSVHSPHGEYVVKGVDKLVEYCYEIKIIEQFHKSDNGNEIIEGVKGYVKGSVRGAVNLVVHPVDSVKGIGRSFSRLGRSVGRIVSTPFRDKEVSGDGIDRTKPASGFLYSSEIRKFAYEIHVDCYSENPYLNGLLRTVAKEREMGRMAMIGGTMLLPGGGTLGSVLQMASWGRRGLTPGGRHEPTEALIRDNDAYELKRILAKNYQDQLGLTYSKGTAVYALLNDFSYSPREQAYTKLYLTDIKPANAEATVRYLANTDSAAQAIYNATQLEMYHALHKGYTPIVRFVPMSNQLASVNDRNELIVIVPWDHTQDQALARALIDETGQVAQAEGAQGAAIWFTGDVSANLAAVAGQVGVRLHRDVAESPIFRFTSFRLLTYKHEPGDPVADDGRGGKYNDESLRKDEKLIPQGENDAVRMSDPGDNQPSYSTSETPVRTPVTESGSAGGLPPEGQDPLDSVVLPGAGGRPPFTVGE